MRLTLREVDSACICITYSCSFWTTLCMLSWAACSKYFHLHCRYFPRTHFVGVCKLLLGVDHASALLAVPLLAVVVQLVAGNLLAVVRHLLQVLVLNKKAVIRI